MFPLLCLTTRYPHDPQGPVMLNQTGSLDPSRGFNAQFGQQQGNGFALGETELTASGLRRGHEQVKVSSFVSARLNAGNIAGALQAGGMQASQLGVR
jgi:hypothetical protein